MKFYKVAKFEDEGHSSEEQIESVDAYESQQELDNMTNGKNMNVHTAEVLEAAGKNIGERLNSSYIANGSVGWFKYQDGIIYEVQVSPMSQGSHIKLFEDLSAFSNKPRKSREQDIEDNLPM